MTSVEEEHVKPYSTKKQINSVKYMFCDFECSQDDQIESDKAYNQKTSYGLREPLSLTRLYIGFRHIGTTFAYKQGGDHNNGLAPQK